MIFRMFLMSKISGGGEGGRCLKFWKNGKILFLGVINY